MKKNLKEYTSLQKNFNEINKEKLQIILGGTGGGRRRRGSIPSLT